MLTYEIGYNSPFHLFTNPRRDKSVYVGHWLHIHTFQPDSFSTVGAFSTVDGFMYNVSIDMI